MRVERADVDAVKNRLEALKRYVASKAANALLPRTSAIDEYDSRLQADLQEKEALKKKLRKEAEVKEVEATEQEGEIAASLFGADHPPAVLCDLLIEALRPMTAALASRLTQLGSPEAAFDAYCMMRSSPGG
jgi:hypothetical protein